MVGRVSHDDLPRFYGCGDVYAMLCRNRWAGLEQEGFGIVFLEAAAAGVPQVAGDERRGGGGGRARGDGARWWTGPTTSGPSRRPSTSCWPTRLGAIGWRSPVGERAVDEFTYDRLATRLGAALAEWEAGRHG